METRKIPSSPRDPCRDEAAQLVQRLKRFYQDFSCDSITRLDTLYTQDVEFRDPVQVARGSLALRHYLRSMAANLKRYRIRYLSEIVGENVAYLTWEMELQHPAIGRGRLITVRGMSQVKFITRIYYHEDSYDLGALVYEHLPLLGVATRAVRRRLAGQ